MIARNHELSAFAVVCVSASLVGVPASGAVVLGCLGAWAGDWPDIDHHGAAVTKSLRWIPYWIDFKRDAKTGLVKLRKDGRAIWSARCFPSLQVHGFFCWLSALIYDRFATPLDRKDSNRAWGPAFRVHRGFTHSIWCALLGGLVWWAALEPWSIWFGLAPMFGATPVPVLVGETVALGMIAHVGGDACTDFGVSPLAPVLKWKGRRYPRMGLWEPLRFKVNKWVEKHIITWLCSVLVVLSMVAAFSGPGRMLQGLGELVGDLWGRLS